MVPVFQMMREATAQIARQTDAVDFAPAIERVHPLPVTEVVPHNFLILLQQITRISVFSFERAVEDGGEQGIQWWVQALPAGGVGLQTLPHVFLISR